MPDMLKECEEATLLRIKYPDLEYNVSMINDYHLYRINQKDRYALAYQRALIDCVMALDNIKKIDKDDLKLLILILDGSATIVEPTYHLIYNTYANKIENAQQ